MWLGVLPLSCAASLCDSGHSDVASMSPVGPSEELDVCCSV